MRFKNRALFDVKEEDTVEVDGGRHYDVPDGVRVIGDNAFKGMVKLTSINIPNSVRKIGFAAFYGCWELQSVKLPKDLVKIGHSAFFGCYNLSKLEVPSSYATKRSEELEKVIPYHVTPEVYSK